MKPMLCKPIQKSNLPCFLKLADNKYVAEIKFDGDRVILEYKNGRTNLFNRRGVNITYQYPELWDFKHPTDLLLDGEMCVMDSAGVSQFNEGIAFRTHCQTPQAIKEAMINYPVSYVVFDILETGWVNLRGKAFRERREVLTASGVSHPRIVISEIYNDPIELWRRVEREGMEGIVLKALDAPYEEGKRGCSWIKVKNIKEVALHFQKYYTHPKGITLENTDGIRITVNGWQSAEVMKDIETTGESFVEIRHLGETKNNRYRQPVFFRRLENEKRLPT